MLFPAPVEIQPSRRLRAALLFVHLLAFVAVASQLPAGLLRLTPLLPLAASLAWSWRRLRGARLLLDRDGSLRWLAPDGGEVAGEVQEDSTCLSWLVVLRLRLPPDAQCRTLLVLTDSVPPAQFRRLQVWMRWIRPFRPRRAGAAG